MKISIALKKFQLLPVIGILLFMFGCSPNTTENGNGTQKVNNDELVARLSPDLVANPTTQREIDQNLIVNYAIDNGLNVQRTPSGLYYVILDEGTGRKPTLINNVAVHYSGTFLDGQEFDSSYKRNEPLTFTLTQVVRGWQEGLQMLSAGGKAILLVPSHLGYGEKGFRDLIKPNTVLRFDVELLSIS